MGSPNRVKTLAAVSFLVCAGMCQAEEYSHGNPTDHEQLMLEFVNEARANPFAEAAALEIDLNQGLVLGTIGIEPKQPLAFHPRLIAAARNHSDWMLATDEFSHTGANASNPTDRAAAVGYPFGVAENIAYHSRTLIPDFSAATLANHDGLFKSPGHRVNLMNPEHSVLGLGIRRGNFAGLDTQMVSQSFSGGGNSTDSGPFLLGVVFDDKNGNGFYDVGEGLPGVRVEPDYGGYHAITSNSGGYAVPLPPAESVTETVNLPFPAVDGSWAQARPYDEAFRREKIRAAAKMTVRIFWSGAAIGGSTLSSETIKRPTRINYRLLGSNNAFFSRTMVSAENVKVDFLLQNPPVLERRFVRFSSNLGEFDVALFESSAPLTTRNFLNYVESGRYDGSFIHRSAPGFVVQGGGFGLNGSSVVPVVTDQPVPNEPGISNVRGTLAMAKSDGNPNSATSQWFINLADNSSNLDVQNGGFTVFARVLGNGMEVADRIASLQTRDLRVISPALGAVPLLGPNATVSHLVRFQSVRTLRKETALREFDFSTGDQGFVAGFADLPAGYAQEEYALEAGHRKLPDELGPGGGLFISGRNNSSDLFMFWKKRISGLLPNTEYRVDLDLEMASNVAEGQVGIGGPPGEGVSIKAGASTAEPSLLLDSHRWLRLSVDKGTQSNNGTAAAVLGNITKKDGSPDLYSRIFRDNRVARQTATSAADGTLWIFFGTESAFMGQTSVFYTKATAVLVPRTKPVLAWGQPAAITAGTAIGSSQLNAMADVAGNFTYSPAPGAVLLPGTHTVSVLFTPADETNYSKVGKSVTLVVNSAGAGSASSPGFSGNAPPPVTRASSITHRNKKGVAKKSAGRKKKASPVKKTSKKKNGSKKIKK